MAPALATRPRCPPVSVPWTSRRPSVTVHWSRAQSGSNSASLLPPSLSGVLNRAIKNELKKNRHSRNAGLNGVGLGCGPWAGNQVLKRCQQKLQAQRAQRIEQRKQLKRERKARGLKNASSGGSASSDTAGSDGADSVASELSTASSSSSHPSTPPSEADNGAVGFTLTETSKVNVNANTKASATCPQTTAVAYRKVVARRSQPIMTDSRIRGADLYVVRLLQDTESKAKAKEQRRRQHGFISSRIPIPTVEPRYADSRPCWRCLEWMYWAGIKRVYWTDPDGDWYGDKVAHLLFGSTSHDSSSATTVYVPVHLTQYEHAAAMLRIKAGSSSTSNVACV